LGDGEGARVEIDVGQAKPQILALTQPEKEPNAEERFKPMPASGL
jgi:hypothetical protein